MANGITSREYKLILAADRFGDRMFGSDALQELAVLLLEKHGARVKTQSAEETRRTWYLDTSDFGLRRAGYVLRIRYEDEDKKYKIALKHRTRDRLLAGDADVSSSAPKDKPKFEEDLLPPFRSIFSRSNSFKDGKLPDLGTVKDAEALFPGLEKLDLPGKAELKKVNGFEALEVFRRLAKAEFDKNTKIWIGLSFWYPQGSRTDSQWPLIAECAYDFDAGKKGGFDLKTVRGANGFFKSLQNQPGWLNLTGTTKTRFAYEGMV
jgi:hypothetical protein